MFCKSHPFCYLFLQTTFFKDLSVEDLSGVSPYHRPTPVTQSLAGSVKEHPACQEQNSHQLFLS